MLRLDNKYLPESFKMFIWYLMSFQAGYINVGGFVVFGSFVSHVTGTSSQIGMGVADLDGHKIITFMTILISFISGAAFSGYNIGGKINTGYRPRFIFVTGIKAIVFLVVLLFSEIYFGSDDLWVKLVLVHLLSFACGVQNATCAQATNGFLKPTHMTGLSTDIGVNLFSHIHLKKNDLKRSEEVKKNAIRIKILTSFIFGGAIAFFIFSSRGHYGFLFPFVSSLLMLYTSIISENAELGNGIDKCKQIKKISIARKSIYGAFVSTIIMGVISTFN